MGELPEYVDGLPNICGAEDRLDAALREGHGHPVFVPAGTIGFGDIESAFAIALHMHQPLVPAGGGDLHTAATISNLHWMMANRGSATTTTPRFFCGATSRRRSSCLNCLHEDYQPRVMLEYSGTLLHGLHQMGANDVLDGLARITRSPSVPAIS